MKLEKMKITPLSDYEVLHIFAMVVGVIVGFLALVSFKFLLLLSIPIAITAFVVMADVIKVWWNNLMYEREKKRNVVFALCEFLKETEDLFCNRHKSYNHYTSIRLSLLEKLEAIQYVNTADLSTDLLLYIESRLVILQEGANKVRAWGDINHDIREAYINLFETTEYEFHVLMDLWMNEQMNEFDSMAEAWSQVLQNTGVIHQKKTSSVELEK